MKVKRIFAMFAANLMALFTLICVWNNLSGQNTHAMTTENGSENALGARLISDNPEPGIDHICLDLIRAGSDPFSLTVEGTNFVISSVRSF